MSRKLAGLLALLIAVPGVVLTLRDYRAGRARLWVSGGVNPLTAKRAISPSTFALYTALNVVVLAVVLLVAVVMAIVP